MLARGEVFAMFDHNFMRTTHAQIKLNSALTNTETLSDCWDKQADIDLICVREKASFLVVLAFRVCLRRLALRSEMQSDSEYFALEPCT